MHRPPGQSTDHYTSKYLDSPNEPLFAFGHGLTYGKFRYANLRISPVVVNARSTLQVQVDLSNEGKRTARETVFVFTHDVVAMVARPVLELAGFGRLELAPGATGTVSIAIPAQRLRYLAPDLSPVFEPGAVEILVGPRASRADLLVGTVILQAE